MGRRFEAKQRTGASHSGPWPCSAYRRTVSTHPPHQDFPRPPTRSAGASWSASTSGARRRCPRASP
eukprot:10167474-Heterocapsa_arctica.AAC.1